VKTWLAGLTTEELQDITKDYTSFKAAEDKWLAEQPREHRLRETGPVKRRAATKVNLKLAIGVEFLRWKAGPGKESNGALKDRSGDQALEGRGGLRDMRAEPL